MEEEWLYIEGYPKYMVSHWGGVKNARFDRMMHVFPGYYGRNRVTLLNSSKRQRILYVDEIVASHFLESYVEGDEIVHIDGDMQNDASWNLRPHSRDEWRVLWSAPNYEVSLTGEVRNRKTGRVLRVRRDGTVYLRDFGAPIQRSIDSLVKEAFLS